jgi:cell division protein FtsB
MIQINLLPPEYRPRPGTPVARFVAIVAGVAVLACASGAYAYTHFIELAKVKELHAVREEESRAKDVQRDRSLNLQREIEAYEKRRLAIQTINRSRTLWSRKLDQFFDIVTGQTEDDGYSVWLENLEVPPQALSSKKRAKPTKKGEEADGGVFRFVGDLAMATPSEAPALSSAFFKALTGDPDGTGQRTDFYSDFLRVNNPSIDIVDRKGRKGAEMIPPVVGTFKYELMLRAPTPPAAAKPEPKAKPSPKAK